MQCLRALAVSTLACLLGSGATLAQDVDPELTITLIPETADSPGAVTQEIELPAAAAEAGMINSAEGIAAADRNRADEAAGREAALAAAEHNRRAGLAIAAEARERVAAARERIAQLGSEIADAAQASRENFVRGVIERDLPVPDGVPKRPKQPDVPDLPDAPAIP